MRAESSRHNASLLQAMPKRQGRPGRGAARLSGVRHARVIRLDVGDVDGGRPLDLDPEVTHPAAWLGDLPLLWDVHLARAQEGLR